MDERDIELFNDSIERCSARPDFPEPFLHPVSRFLRCCGEAIRAYGLAQASAAAQDLALYPDDGERRLRTPGSLGTARQDAQPGGAGHQAGTLRSVARKVGAGGQGMRPEARSGYGNGLATGAATGNRFHEIKVLTPGPWATLP